MQRKPYILAAILILASAGFLPTVLAGDETAHDSDEPSHVAVDSGHEGGEAHDKQDLLDWDFGAALWTIVVFVILLTVLRLTAWKPILAGLNERETFIRDSLAQAKKDREEAERVLAEHAAKLEQAHAEAAEIVEEGRRDGEETRKRIESQARGEADALIQRAKREIELARDDAVKQVHNQAIELATAVAGKMIRRELTATDHQALLDESLNELGRMNN